MIALTQRVSRAEVRVGGEVVGSVGPGLLVLLGVERGDGPKEAGWLAEKCAHLRVFPDEHSHMNRSLLDAGGSALVVSQFTLLGDTSRGRRPGFERAAPPEEAERMYGEFCEALARAGVPVQTGRFRAHMEVELVNDGPVTFLVQTRVEDQA